MFTTSEAFFNMLAKAAREAQPMQRKDFACYEGASAGSRIAYIDDTGIDSIDCADVIFDGFTGEVEVCTFPRTSSEDERTYRIKVTQIL